MYQWQAIVLHCWAGMEMCAYAMLCMHKHDRKHRARRVTAHDKRHFADHILVNSSHTCDSKKLSPLIKIPFPQQTSKCKTEICSPVLKIDLKNLIIWAALSHSYPPSVSSAPLPCSCCCMLSSWCCSGRWVSSLQRNN